MRRSEDCIYAVEQAHDTHQSPPHYTKDQLFPQPPIKEKDQKSTIHTLFSTCERPCPSPPSADKTTSEPHNPPPSAQRMAAPPFTSLPYSFSRANVRATEKFKAEDFAATHPGRGEEAAERYNRTLYRGCKKDAGVRGEERYGVWRRVKGLLFGGRGMG